MRVACVMGISSLQILVEAAKRLAEGFSGDKPEVEASVIVCCIMGSTILIKAARYVYCSQVSEREKSSAVDAYAQDYQNDILTNSIGLVSESLRGHLYRIHLFSSICLSVPL